MSPNHPAHNTHAKEAHFHDDWAMGEDPGQIHVREVFESPVAMENQFILRRMGDLTGKRLLDIGAGLGESSVYFALRGARVTTVDLSPGMVEFAQKLGKAHGVSIQGAVAAAEDLNVGQGCFDIVYAANVLHHVADKRAFFQQIHRALAPGGWFFTIDPLRYNPVINVYRRMGSEVRTEDERPLGFEDLAIPRRLFGNVNHREFWILTLSLFLKFYLLDRVHPNQQRYWKKIFSETAAGLWWWRPLRLADAVLARLPLLRRLAWNMVMWGQKGRENP